MHSKSKKSAKSAKSFKLKTASWNVRTLLDNEDPRVPRPQRRSALVALELKKAGIDIAALSEVRLHSEGELAEKEGGYTFFWKGVEEGEAQNLGVGFAIKTSLLPNFSTRPVGINERIILFRFPISKSKWMNIISVYAPTMSASLESYELFYEQLSETIRGIPKQDKILLLGDFNARVGNDWKTWKGVLGKYGVGKANRNGKILLEFCTKHQLAICNSFFCHRKIHQCTWQHPRSKHWHLIDYAITRKSDLKSIQDTRVMRSVECWTDHRLLRTKISIRIYKPRSRCSRKKEIKGSKLNIELLKDQAVQSKVTAKLKTAYEGIDCEKGSIDEIWDNFKDATFRVCSEELGCKKRKHQDWFDENNQEIISMLEEKRRLMNICDSDRKAKSKLRILKGQIQKRLRAMKNDWWLNKAKEIQGFADRNDSKNLYQSLKEVFGPKISNTQSIKSADGDELFSEKEEINCRWAEYFENLLNIESNVDMDVLNHFPQQLARAELCDPVSVEEIEKAIKLLSNGAPGEDGITPEIYKGCKGAVLDILLKIINKIWSCEKVPKDWRDALFVTIFKNKGDITICGNHRGISLLSVAGKIFAKILLIRLTPVVEEMLPEPQCGFRKTRSTADMVFTVRQLQEKCKEHNLDLYMVFIDLTKAYDTVNRVLLWKLLERFGIPAKIINIIRSFHENMIGKLAVDSSKSFPINNGLRQGCIFAPLLFNFFFAAMTNYAFAGVKAGIPIRYRFNHRIFDVRNLRAKSQVKETLIRELLYADDGGLVSHSLEELQMLLSKFCNAASKFGLTVSLKKTESVQQISRQHALSALKIGDYVLKVLDDFVYLGGVISKDASLDKEIDRRIGKASKAFGALWKRLWNVGDIHDKTKIAIYRAVVLSTLLCGCQSWNVYRKHVHKLESFHFRCLRSIMKIDWRDHVPNTEVLRKANVPLIETMLKHCRLKWLGHIRRMDDNRIPKQILFGEPTMGKRKASKPYQRWRDLIRKDFKDYDINETSWFEDCDAANRSSWRSKLHEANKLFEQEKIAHIQEMRKARKLREAENLSSLQDINGCFPCDFPGCNKTFLKLSSMRKHKALKHSERPPTSSTTCTKCGKTFKGSGYKRHKCLAQKKRLRRPESSED